MTAAHTRRPRASSRPGRLALIASVLLGLAAMHGASSVAMAGGGHGPVSLPVTTGGPAALPRAHAAHGDVAAHRLDPLAGTAVPTLGADDVRSHHAFMVGCALALTGIVTLALVRLVSRGGQSLVRRPGTRRARPGSTARLPRAGPRPVPRFSLGVLRT